MAHIAIRQRKDGTKSYRVKWRDPDGVFRERTFATKKAAQEHANSVETDKRRSEYHDERKAALTFREVAEEWLPMRIRKARTNAEYRRILDVRIFPTFGARKIGSIRMSDCTRFRDALIKEGLRPTSVTKVFGLFAVILRFAVKRRYIRDNPAADLDMPTNTSAEVEAFEGRYLTPAEFEKLVQQVAWFNPTYGLVVRLLGTTGMRVGELAGLNIEDVHILGARGTISVHCTYDRRFGLSPSPKTSRSNRTVTLTPAVVPALAEHLAARRAGGAGDGDPLFNARKGGGHYMDDWIKPTELPRSKHASEPKADRRPFDPDMRFDAMAFYKRIWRRAVFLAGVEPMRIHDLRHTAASFMLSSGMPLAMVSRQLGHESTSTTDKIYGGLLRDSFDSAIDAFGDWYERQSKQPTDARGDRLLREAASR